jgi:DNA-binding beta-propeller fold protein YncE
VVCVLVVVTGCGSESVHELPPAAEPPRSPPLAERPAGHVERIGGEPEGIVADSVTGRVAVALRDPGRLALLDAASGRVVRRVTLPGAARHLALALPGGPVLVPTEDADRLVAIDLRSGLVLRSVRVGERPHDAAAVGGSWFVGDEGGNEVSVVGIRVRSFRVATQPGGVVPLAGAVGVISVRERRFELYDARTLHRLDSAPAGVGPTHGVCLGRGPCLVLDTHDGALLVYSLRPHLELVRRLGLPGGPYGIALDAARGRVWVTLPGLNQVVELPADGRPHVLRRFPTVRQPDTVAVDERTGRVFVTGRAAGELEWIDP